jgi:hypothetical protein
LPFACIAYASLHCGAALSPLAGGQFDAGIFMVFCVWLMPIAFLWNQEARRDWFLLALGGGSTLAGVLSQESPLIIAGLALSLAALLPFSINKLIWVAAAVGWMPEFRAFEPSVPASALLWGRMGVAVFGVIAYAWTANLRGTRPLECSERPVRE